MSTDTLEHALQELPNNGQALPAASNIKKLGASWSMAIKPLQSFSGAASSAVVPRLFSAVAGVVWLKAHAAGGAIFGVPLSNGSRHPVDALDQKKHEKLVQLAWQQRQPMLAEPHTTLPKAK